MRGDGSHPGLGRRDFLKAAGAIGLVASAGSRTDATQGTTQGDAIPRGDRWVRRG